MSRNRAIPTNALPANALPANEVSSHRGATDSRDVAVLDVATVVPHGRPCSACGAPIEDHDPFCSACGTPMPVPLAEVAPEPAARHGFQCESCGSRVDTEAEQRSYVCPFCDSTYVLEYAPAETGRQAPEFVIGFAVTPERARACFEEWLGRRSWFRPSDLRTASVVDRLRGVYLPFWSFSMLADSRWSAAIGMHWYRTETYTTRDSQGKTVTRTRRVQETEWHALHGAHHEHYSGHFLSASRGLTQAEAERIFPFQWPALRRYAPYFLAGWLCEEFSLTREEALPLCQQEFRNRERASIAAFLPGDTHRNLQVTTDFRHVHSDLCLLPVYVLTYRYSGRLYRFLLNGQTGRFAGDKPLSWHRIGAFALVIAMCLIAAALLIALGRR